MQAWSAKSLYIVVMGDKSEVNSDGGHGIKKCGGDRAKERILLAASMLFASQDYESCSIRDIAQEAEVNSALIYYYFGSKEGLLRFLIEEAVGRLAALLDSLLVKPEMTTREKLHDFLVEWLSVVAGRGHIKTLIFRTMGIQGTVGELLRERVLANIRRIASILAEGQEKGEVRTDVPVDRLAMQVTLCLLAPVIGFPFPALVDVSMPEARDVYVTDSLDMVFRGIGPR